MRPTPPGPLCRRHAQRGKISYESVCAQPAVRAHYGVCDAGSQIAQVWSKLQVVALPHPTQA